MADGSGGSALSGVIIGVLLVVIVAAGIFAYTGGNFGNSHDLNVKVEAPNVPNPADAG